MGAAEAVIIFNTCRQAGLNIMILKNYLKIKNLKLKIIYYVS